MFEQVKEEPSSIEEKRDEESILVEDFVFQTNQSFKTEAYYCTRLGQVKGNLIITDTHLQFDAF